MHIHTFHTQHKGQSRNINTNQASNVQTLNKRVAQVLACGRSAQVSIPLLT